MDFGPEDLDALEQVARAASSAAWKKGHGRNLPSNLASIVVAKSEEDWTFIAEVSPAVVLGLIEAARDSVKLREEERQRARSVVDDGTDFRSAAVREEALRALQGTEYPSVEQQRDAAFQRVADFMVENNFLRITLEETRHALDVYVEDAKRRHIGLEEYPVPWPEEDRRQLEELIKNPPSLDECP